MVRKWSYLNNLKTSPFLKTNHPLNAVYNFKVFKATTRFKYPNNTSFTKGVRKKYSRRRHRSNWFNMVFITRFWVNFFLKNKQFLRFYQSLGLVQNQSYSTSLSLVGKQLMNLNSGTSFSTFACSRSIINYFVVSCSGWDTRSPLLNIPVTGLLTDARSTINDLSDINPGLVQFDNLLYPYNSELEPYHSAHLEFLNTNDSLFHLVLHKNLVLYKIITLISVVNSLGN